MREYRRKLPGLVQKIPWVLVYRFVKGNWDWQPGDNWDEGYMQTFRVPDLRQKPGRQRQRRMKYVERTG